MALARSQDKARTGSADCVEMLRVGKQRNCVEPRGGLWSQPWPSYFGGYFHCEHLRGSSQPRPLALKYPYLTKHVFDLPLYLKEIYSSYCPAGRHCTYHYSSYLKNCDDFSATSQSAFQF